MALTECNESENYTMKKKTILVKCSKPTQSFFRFWKKKSFHQNTSSSKNNFIKRILKIVWNRGNNKLK
jgi:hypothetical protein